MRHFKNCNFNPLFKVAMSSIVLTIIAGWCSCTTYKINYSITSKKAQALRDSARKYSWAVLSKEKATVYYDSLFTSSYLVKRDYYEAGQVAAEMGLYTKCIAIWTKMLKVKNDDGFDYSYYLPNMVGPQFDYYEGLINAKGFKKLWAHYPEYPLELRLSPQDSGLAKKINKMFIADQTVRHRYLDSPTVQNSYLWNRCDSINAVSVDSIIVNRGVINSKTFGYKASRDFLILFVHLPDSLLKKYMPLIEAANKNKVLGRTYYALIKDRFLIYQKKEQIYGTQLHIDTISSRNVFFPIWHVESVDKRRKKVGLTQLKFYAEQNKAALPNSYKF